MIALFICFFFTIFVGQGLKFFKTYAKAKNQKKTCCNSDRFGENNALDALDALDTPSYPGNRQAECNVPQKESARNTA